MDIVAEDSEVLHVLDMNCAATSVLIFFLPEEEIFMDEPGNNRAVKLPEFTVIVSTTALEPETDNVTEFAVKSVSVVKVTSS